MTFDIYSLLIFNYLDFLDFLDLDFLDLDFLDLDFLDLDLDFLVFLLRLVLPVK
jgi:hypothetical protein